MDHTNRYTPPLEHFSKRVREALLARLKGVTLTQEDAEIIIQHVRICTAPLKPKGVIEAFKDAPNLTDRELHDCNYGSK